MCTYQLYTGPDGSCGSLWSLMMWHGSANSVIQTLSLAVDMEALPLAWGPASSAMRRSVQNGVKTPHAGSARFPSLSLVTFNQRDEQSFPWPPVVPESRRRRAKAAAVREPSRESFAVCSWNEWDPLREVIVGTAR